MSDSIYDAGVMTGMETLLIEAQARHTFDALSTSIGKLTCTGDPREPWNAGYMHGISLAANMIAARACQTVTSRVIVAS